jgi:hypothetical protein
MIAGGEAAEPADGLSVFGNMERWDLHGGYGIE